MQHKNSIKCKTMYLKDLLLYLFCGLPFLSLFIPFPMDIQPYALLMATIYLCIIGNIRIKKETILIFAICMFASVFAVISMLGDRSDSEIFMIIRKVFNYISFFVVSLSVYNSFCKTNGLVERWIKILILIWLAVGLIQTFWTPYFMKEFVANMRTSGNRGVTSLASEPSFYGYMMIFMGLLASRFKKRRDRIVFEGLCLLQIIFLAKSAVTLIYLVVFIGFYAIVSFFSNQKISFERLRMFIIAGFLFIAFVIVTYHIMITYFPEQRMVVIIRNLIKNISSIHSISDIYRIDGSVGIRSRAVYETLVYFLQGLGFPHGFISDMRYSSGFGATLYELGVFGLCLIILIVYRLYRGYGNNLVVAGGIAAMMFSAVQFASPMFAFVYGYSLFLFSSKKVTN